MPDYTEEGRLHCSDTETEVMLGPKAFDRLEPTWHELEKLPGSNVFQSYGWCRAWWDAVGSSAPNVIPHLLQISVHRTAVAIVPLMETRGLSLTFLTSPWADFHDILVDGVYTDSVVSALSAYLEERSREGLEIRLGELPPTSPLLEMPRYLPGMSVVSTSICPRLDLLDAAAFLDATSKRTTLLQERRLRRSARVEVTFLSDLESIRQAIDGFIRLHTLEWQGDTSVVAPFTDPIVEQFFRSLVERLAPGRSILLARLTADGHPAAYRFCFDYGGVISEYRSCIARDYAQRSPGHVLLRHLLLEAQKRGARSFDFLRGGYDFKFRYASSTTQNFELNIAARTSRDSRNQDAKGASRGN